MNFMINNVGTLLVILFSEQGQPMLTGRQFIETTLHRNSTLLRRPKINQLALSPTSSTFCITAGAKIPTVPAMDAIGFLMQLIAYTSSRPGAIIESNCYKGLDQVFKMQGPSQLPVVVIM
jgi:hypothetical protein